MSHLTDKTVIITGASSGVGRALARLLAERGVRVTLNARSEDALREAAAECHGAEAVAAPGDASAPGVAEALVRQAQAMGRFAGFIHAAGVLHPGPLLTELSEEAFWAVVNASFTAAWRLMRACAPQMDEAERGVAVVFGSGAAEIIQPGIAAYCAAKAGEEHLLRQFAAETKTVSAFIYRPGIVDTRMQTQARQAEGGGADALHEIFRPWKEEGKLISPEESAMGLVALLEEDPRALHGKTLRAGEAP